MLQNRHSFSYDDLIACAKGDLFGEGNCRLPLPPMLMFDRIQEIYREGGNFGQGYVQADFAINPDLWFFSCHFQDDPVMPGCLGLDALWQLLGFFLGWCGGTGLGRALGVGQVKFKGMVLPTSKTVTYQLHIKKLIMRRLIMGVAEGKVLVDGEEIYQADDLRVGLFTQEQQEA